MWVETVELGSRFHAADPGTGRPVAFPDDLAGGERVYSVAGSSDWLLWTSQPVDTPPALRVGPTLHAWDLRDGRVYTYRDQGDDVAYQFFTVAGDLAFWRSTSGSLVMNLTTGASVPWPNAGVLPDARPGDGRVYVSAYDGKDKADRSGTTTIRGARIAALPSLGACPV